ncbi:type III-B CRISPR-associated protein Cas10/Cmr2 [Saccharolobus solfataricus]|nr:type III-B CRISPR-associated protein Cas10/Cmr2 [Saccharolobus solfataricus]
MEKFREIIDKFIEKQTGNTLDKTKIFKLIKSVYFLIYTIYEPLWIYFGLPVEVEDSRSPFYTIFDHLYASASMINWVYYDDRSDPKGKKGKKTQQDTYSKNAPNPKGFYVVIDIPGVQEIINSARKASDYWAGSWMLSMIIWLTVWQLIKEYGPDVLLAPTTRFNPIYYAMTLNYLEKEFGMDDGLKKEIEEILNTILGKLSGIYDYTQFLKEAIIPATASLILPKEQNTCSIKLEQEIFEYYKNAYNCIVKEIPTGNVQSDICKEFVEAFNIIYQSNSTLDNLMNVIINEAEKYADKILIRPAIYIVDIDDIRDEVESDLRNKNVNAILNNKQFNQLVPQYIFHYISTKLFREKVKEKYKREILPKPNWFTSFNKEFDYINGGKNWEYCTVCGNEPAIINFGKENDDYSASTKCEILRLAYQNRYKVTDDDLKDLKVWFKPGEKLGPLCIIKRGLYFRLRKNLEKVFKSTDDIAYSYYKNVIQPRIKDLDECEKLKNFLNAEELDVYETFGNPVIARRLFSKCTEVEDKKLPCIQKEYGVSDVNNAFIDALKGYREFYAIVKADADDMTELARGEIDAEKYFEVLPRLIKEGEFEEKESKNPKNRACKFLIYTYSNMTSIAKVINDGNILMSPTYRVALSLAMMITLLRDIKTVEVENYGQIIYAGGDDVVALVPIDRLIDTLIGLERNFVGENGFFKVRQWYIPTFYPHGRSFSVRIANIADFMTNEIQMATELLNRVKKVKWEFPNGEEKRSKFSAILSTSRTSYESVLPMWDFKYLILLKKMWLLNLSNKLSSSVFEDYESAFKEFITSERKLTKRLINYVLLKNNGKELVEDFNKLDFLSLNKKSNVYNEIFKAFRIMRGVI